MFQVEKASIDHLHEIVYRELDSVLNAINKPSHVKLYAIAPNEHKEVGSIVRLKKTLAGEGRTYRIMQEPMHDTDSMLTDLKVGQLKQDDNGDVLQKLTDYFRKERLKETVVPEEAPVTLFDDPNEQPHSTPPIILNDVQDNQTRILCVYPLRFHHEDKVLSFRYVVEVRSITQEAHRLYYDKPHLSFLHTILDCFFTDYFLTTKDECIDSSSFGTGPASGQQTLRTKYFEDIALFARRASRIFFGKMQSLLRTGEYWHHQFADAHSFDRFYASSLLEQIDEISSKQYEHASPFGSILFLNREAISKQGVVRFTIKFSDKKLIPLDDSRRIRKLLELTNADKDLYLIADPQHIYGLGEVSWNLLPPTQYAFRIDFKGLAKFNLVRVYTDMSYARTGELVIDKSGKYYRAEHPLMEEKLIAISFKNPRLAEEGFSSEKFARLLKHQFWKTDTDDEVKEQIDKLDEIVAVAREQKHGTMVVIADAATARAELQLLDKQSTLIEPCAINPEYMRYLTAIDGAVYVDTEGKCHAIGVILDGEAQQDVGDAARGARFNSAHRYLHKLKSKEPPLSCVIAIISEDGMVDLIPEIGQEKLFYLAGEVVDAVNKNNPNENAEKLLAKKTELLQSETVDYNWLFQIGEAYYSQEQYLHANEFFERALQLAGNGFVSFKNYDLVGQSMEKLRSEDGCIRAMEIYELALGTCRLPADTYKYYRSIATVSDRLCELLRGTSDYKKKLKTQSQHTIEFCTRSIAFAQEYNLVQYTDMYNLRGINYHMLCAVYPGEYPDTYNDRAIEDFSSAIKLKDSKAVLYGNRAYVYEKQNKPKEAAEDLITTECLGHNDRHIERLKELLDRDRLLVAHAVASYSELAQKGKRSAEIESLLASYGNGLPFGDAESAAAKEQQQLDQESRPPDEKTDLQDS